MSHDIAVTVTDAQPVQAVVVDAAPVLVTASEPVIAVALTEAEPIEVRQALETIAAVVAEEALQVTLAGGGGAAGVEALLSVTAGEAIGGHRAVVLLDGEALLADPGNPAHASRQVALTTQAATAGGDVLVQTFGQIVEPSWFWTPDVPVWVGPLGTLTQTPPSSGWAQILGYPTAGDTLFVAPQGALFFA